MPNLPRPSSARRLDVGGTTPPYHGPDTNVRVQVTNGQRFN
jgi:hypothetical protein